ncbi:MAG: peptidase S24 [Gammaproteobacteria bacterium]|nr:MAG: peptidase S24 [Gammaproteobacteria bacterium]
MISVFKIQGESMSPRLSGGDFVVASRFYITLSEGDIVVVQHPVYGRIIKRVKHIGESGRFLLTGENEQSLSSEQMGWLARSTIKAKVLFSGRKNTLLAT